MRPRAKVVEESRRSEDREVGVPEGSRAWEDWRTVVQVRWRIAGAMQGGSDSGSLLDLGFFSFRGSIAAGVCAIDEERDVAVVDCRRNGA